MTQAEHNALLNGYDGNDRWIDPKTKELEIEDFLIRKELKKMNLSNKKH